MNGKIMKKTITACVAVLLIVALAITLASFLNKPMSADAAGNTLTSNYLGTHGQLTDVDGGHRTDSQEVEYLTTNKSANSSQILKITTGQQFFNFLNGQGSEANYTHAYLANDVYIAYSNKDIDAQYTKISQNSSGAIFNKVFDGNGYTANIWGGTGVSVYSQTQDNYFSYGTTYYKNTGYLVAINRGTIENLIVEFRSEHRALTATKGGVDSGQGFQGQDNDSSTGLFTENGSAGTCAGIVTGFNDNGGVIDNVRVNINNPLKVIDWRDNNNGDMNKNFAFVGGIVGRAGRGSLLNNSQIHIADNASITCAAQGYNVGSLSTGAGLAVAGGLVGKIDQGTTENNVTLNAEVKYCAVTGGGFVRSFVEKARYGDGSGGTASGNDGGGYRAYTGGAIGGCFNITVRLGGLQDGGMSSGTKHEVNRGQITGIISSWTGYTQNNYENNNTVSYGQLFGSCGSNVESMMLLFDVMALRSGESDTNQTLDSAYSSVLSDWVSVYPTTEGGTVNVRLNLDANSRYDFRIHAFATDPNKTNDQIDAELLADDLGDASYKRQTLSNGQTGNIIWRATMGTTERISLTRSNPVSSEINLISSSTTGSYAYTFGTMTSLTLDGSANGSSNSRLYQGKNVTLTRPTAIAASGATVELKDSEWIITRNGVQTNSDMSGTALPGTYVMNVKAETQTFTDLGYYSESQRLAAWIPSSYNFIIAEGELNYGRVDVSDTWSGSAEFQLMMNSADDFDSIRCVRNGSVIKSDDDYESNDDFVYSRNGNEVTITIMETTGKNGTTYSFIAYAKDGDKDIIVAKTKASEDRLVKIDREKPEISEITYYTRDSQGKETKISANDRFTWRKDRIVAKYNVSDAKSGIKFAPSSIGAEGVQIMNRKQADGSYNVEVILSKNDNYVITYTDNSSNTLDVELQANVDYMSNDPTLAQARAPWYPYRSNYGYSTEGARIYFNPSIGCSEWKLQYSWQKNPDGTDKWEDAMVEGSKTDLYYLNGSGQQSFLIDWNMYDTVKKIGYDFKLRMVNVQGLYGDDTDHAVYYSKNNVESEDGFVSSFAINYKIANIYVDKSLKGLTISGGAFDGKDVAWVIANATQEELAELFNKQYDATDRYDDMDSNGNVISFNVNINFGAEQREDVQQFAEDTGIGVLYSPAYIAYPESVETTIKVELRYESANAGEQVNLIATFVPSEEDDGKYNFYFADNSKIDFTDAYTPVPDRYLSSPMIIPTATKITPYKTTVQLAYTRGLQRVYMYGETVPETLTVNIGVSSQPIEIKLDCLAQSIRPVTDPEDEETWYPCEGTVLTDVGGNMDITIIGTTIGIEARPVYVDIKLDGKADLPSSVSAGREYKFTAEYYDPVAQTTKSANVRMVSDVAASEPVLNGPIYNVGNYTITVSIADKNFTVKDAYRDKDGNVIDTDDIYVFYFSIRQGQLALAMGVNVVEYADGNQIKYNPGIPAGLNNELFSEEGLTYTYYPYYANATYNATTRKITGEYDRTKGTSESPSEIGLYHVEVSYAGSKAFFAETYENGDIVITKARTEMIFGSTIKYNFDVDENKDPIWRCLDVNTARALVQSINSKQELWNWASADEKPELRVLYLTDKGDWKEVGSEPGSDGWFCQVGVYSYRVEYDGDDNYEKCAASITMTIDKALFKGITFQGVSGVFDGSDYVAKLSPTGLGAYPSATVTYRYAGTTYTSLRDIHISNAGNYTVTMVVRDPDYVDERIDATISISRAKIVGITAVPIDVTYDGKSHRVTFLGFDNESADGKYVYRGYNVRIAPVSNEVGDIYATNAGNYNGKVRISIDNYETLEIATFIKIDKAKIEVNSAEISLPNQLPSGMSVLEYFGTYMKDGVETTEVPLIFKDEAGNVVTPNSNGVIPDGNYTVQLNVGDNYFIAMEWEFVVGNINAKNLSVPAIVAVVAVVVIMLAAIITSVVVVNKRKKNEVIG